MWWKKAKAEWLTVCCREGTRDNFLGEYSVLDGVVASIPIIIGANHKGNLECVAKGQRNSHIRPSVSNTYIYDPCLRTIMHRFIFKCSQSPKITINITVVHLGFSVQLKKHDSPLNSFEIESKAVHETRELHRGFCRAGPGRRGQRCLGCSGILRRGQAGAALQTFCRKPRPVLQLAAERSACLSFPLPPWPPPHQQVNKIRSVITGNVWDCLLTLTVDFVHCLGSIRTDRRGKKALSRSKTASLLIFRTSPEDSGSYMCVATSIFNKTQVFSSNCSIFITVKG